MKLFKKDRRSMVEKEIDRIMTRMSKIEDQSSEEYKKYADMLEKLVNINTKKISKNDKEKLSPNTVAVVLGGIAEMLIIMTYERTHVIATKAFGRILRGRA